MPDPTTGLGIQYHPTEPDLPSIDSINYLDNRLRQADEKHEVERQKLMPDKKLYQDLLSKTNLTGGQMAKVGGEFDSAYGDYKAKASENPDYVFSNDGRRELGKIEGMLSPTRLRALQDQATAFRNDEAQSIKNGTHDNTFVKDGKVAVRFDDGKVSMVDVDQAMNLDPKHFTVLKTGKDIAAHGHNLEDLSQHSIQIGGQKTALEARNVLGEAFDKTGYTQMDSASGLQNSRDNLRQLQSAKKQAKESLPATYRDALFSSYLSDGQGPKSKAGFEKYLDSVLDEEVNKRRVNTFKVDDATKYNSGAGGGGSASGALLDVGGIDDRQPDYYTTDTTNLFGNGKVSTVIPKGQVSTKEVNPQPKTINLSSGYYAVGNTGPNSGAYTSNRNRSDYGKSSNGKADYVWGRPSPHDEKGVSIQEKQFTTRFIKTGQELKVGKRDQSGNIISYDYKHHPERNGDMVMNDTANESIEHDIDNPENAVHEGFDPRIGAYKYVQNKAGDRFVVNERSFLEAEDIDNGRTIFIPTDKTTSIRAFDKNYSSSQSGYKLLDDRNQGFGYQMRDKFSKFLEAVVTPHLLQQGAKRNDLIPVFKQWMENPSTVPPQYQLAFENFMRQMESARIKQDMTQSAKLAYTSKPGFPKSLPPEE